MMCNESYEDRENKWAFWVAIEFFKAGGDKCLESLTNIYNDILFTDNYRRKGY